MDDLNGLSGLARSPLARRGFVMSGLMSGLTLAATRVEAQVIHTDTIGLDDLPRQIAAAVGVPLAISASR